MGTTNLNSRVQKHRNSLRSAGLRPVQIWVPNTRRPGFTEECRRQTCLIAESDMADTDLQEFIDKAKTDVNGWAE
ncbi:MAG: antitoxin MazE family protein [Betaproteobacteria bacterium]|nr:DUF3018 family protein [Betaproteobacteria bacterium]MDE2424029.1 antitoxin MazE family protein [Betaproteobacteria bacterium]